MSTIKKKLNTWNHKIIESKFIQFHQRRKKTSLFLYLLGIILCTFLIINSELGKEYTFVTQLLSGITYGLIISSIIIIIITLDVWGKLKNEFNKDQSLFNGLIFICLIVILLFIFIMISTPELFMNIFSGQDSEIEIYSIKYFFGSLLIYITFLLAAPVTFWGISYGLIKLAYLIKYKTKQNEILTSCKNKFRGKTIYQSVENKSTITFYQFVSRLIVYLLTAVSSFYVVFSLLAEKPTEDTVTNQLSFIIMSFVIISVYLCAFFFTYFKRKMILFEMGLIIQENGIKLKQIEETSLFRNNIRNYITYPVILSIISIIVDVDNIIENINLYLNVGILLFLFSMLIIIQGVILYLNHLFSNRSAKLKEEILRTFNIKSGRISIDFEES